MNETTRPSEESLLVIILKHTPFRGLKDLYYKYPEDSEERRRIYTTIRKRVFSRKGETSLEIINWLIKEAPIPSEEEAERFVLKVASRGLSFVEGRAALLSAMFSEFEKDLEDKVDGK